MSDRYNGLLNVYKEAGWTSNDVVAKLRGILRQKKIGHTGTLDPDAVGVLVCCLGSATRLVEELTEHTKEYIAVCRLGVATDTQDLSGNVLSYADVEADPETVRAVVQRFQGDYDQVPPMYSALKVNGKRLYTLAREGKEVERKPRRVHIDAISVIDMSRFESYNEFTMEVKCTKGTYIRTLCADIGEALGCGGAMAHLTRTAVGSFTMDTALPLAEIQRLADAGTLAETVTDMETFFRDLDEIVVKREYDIPLKNGNALRQDMLALQQPPDAQDDIPAEALYRDGERLRVYDEDRVFIGIYRYDTRKQLFQTDKFFYR